MGLLEGSGLILWFGSQPWGPQMNAEGRRNVNGDGKRRYHGFHKRWNAKNGTD